MIVRFSARSRDGLDAIRHWIARDNPVRAVSFVDELIDACEALRDFPSAFPVYRGESRRQLRNRNHRGYLIFYEVARETVEIVAIIHGARDLSLLV